MNNQNEIETKRGMDLFSILRYALLGYGIYKTLGPKFLIGCFIGYVVGKGTLPFLKSKEQQVSGYEILCETPGLKIKSKGLGRGMVYGRGYGPVGIPIGLKALPPVK